MDVEFIKNEDNHIEAYIDADIGFLQLVKSELLNNKSVKFAAVTKDHPFKNPRLVVKTKGKTKPIKAIKDATDKVKKMMDDFESKLK